MKSHGFNNTSEHALP